MTGNQRLPVFCRPVTESFFYGVLFPVVFSSAGGVVQSQQFQRSPEIADQKACQMSESVIEQITLMSMGEKDFPSVLRIGEEQTFLCYKSRKEGLLTVGGFAEIMVAGFREKGLAVFHPVMISIEHVETVLPVELCHQPETVGVNLYDLLHISVLPQLIAVSQLNVSEAFFVIICQGCEEEILVFQKIVTPVPDTTVAVAHNYDGSVFAESEDWTVSH